MRNLIARYRRLRVTAADAGVTTVEYAVAIAAGTLFAGVLIKVIGSAAVFSALSRVITKAIG